MNYHHMILLKYRSYWNYYLISTPIYNEKANQMKNWPGIELISKNCQHSQTSKPEPCYVPYTDDPLAIIST